MNYLKRSLGKAGERSGEERGDADASEYRKDSQQTNTHTHTHTHTQRHTDSYTHTYTHKHTHTDQLANTVPKNNPPQERGIPTGARQMKMVKLSTEKNIPTQNRRVQPRKAIFL